MAFDSTYCILVAQLLFARQMTNSTARLDPPTAQIIHTLFTVWWCLPTVTMQNWYYRCTGHGCCFLNFSLISRTCRPFHEEAFSGCLTFLWFLIYLYITRCYSFPVLIILNLFRSSIKSCELLFSLLSISVFPVLQSHCIAAAEGTNGHLLSVTVVLSW